MKRDCPDFYRNEEQNPSLSAFEVKRFNLTLLKKLTVFTNKYGYTYWLLTVFSFGEGGGGSCFRRGWWGLNCKCVLWQYSFKGDFDCSICDIHASASSFTCIAPYGWFTVIVTFSFCQERPNFNEILSELKSMSGDGRYNSINN